MQSKTAFVFSGQGSQSVGMGFSLAQRFEDFSKIYTEQLATADRILGFELSKIMQEGPADKLQQTEITQPALLTASTAMSKWLEKNDVKAELAMGHSLGEYSALVHADSIDFEEALKVVHLRGKLMAQAVPSGEGGMAALVGASVEEAKAICELVKDKPEWVLEPSVFNTSGQVVISGHAAALDFVEPKAASMGSRKFARLDVSGPFHCSLLSGAGEKLGEALESIEIRRPRIKVVSNVTALPQHDPSEIKRNLVLQVSKPVLWADSVRFAGEDQFTNFIEVGSGKVLTGLIRKTLPDVKCTPLENLQRLELLAA